MDSQLEKGEGAAQGTLGSVEGRAARGGWARGRRAAPAPDGSGLPAKLTAPVRQRFGFLNGLFNALADRRKPDDCLYTAATVLWMAVLGFLCRKGRATPWTPTATPAWPRPTCWRSAASAGGREGRPVTAPCTQTVTRFLDILDPGRLEEVLAAVTDSLLRGKLLDSARLDGTTLFFCAWVTNFPIHSGERARGVAAAGRSRSRIEESYNVQKNGGFGLEHAFRETDKGAANCHLLMQLAHTLWQLLVKGRLRREMAGCRKLTDECLAKLLAAALQYCGPPADPLPAFQLRFADG